MSGVCGLLKNSRDPSVCVCLNGVFFFFFKGLLLLQTGSNVIDPNNYHVCEGRPVFENHPFMCRYVCLCIGMIIWRVRVCVLRNKVKTSVCIICDERVDWKIKRLSFCCCRRHIVIARWVIYIIIVSLYPSRNLCRSPTRRSCVHIYYLVGKWIFYVKNIWCRCIIRIYIMMVPD